MPPPDKVQMSSIIPRFVLRRVGAFIERRLSLRQWDMLNQFWVQSRLLFSRSIVLLVGAMFLFFTWLALAEEIYKVDEVFIFLTMQTAVLAIILNMSLWEVERDGRTFELLIMRIPNLHRLIWFKMRVSLIWLVVLTLPFVVAFAWFTSIPPGRMLLFMIFCFSSGLMIAFLTCVIASFVHHGLTTGIISFILVFITIGFMDNANGLPYIDYYRLFVIKTERLTQSTPLTLIVNRLVLLVVVAGFYCWLQRRLGKTEKWIQ